MSSLPPLPEPWVCVRDNDDKPVSVWRAFQMRDYARLAAQPLLAELREAVALEGFGCACTPTGLCGTCRSRDVLSKVIGPILKRWEAKQ